MDRNKSAVTGEGTAPRRTIEIRGRKFETMIRDGKEFIGSEIKPQPESIVPSHHGTLIDAQSKLLAVTAQRDELLASGKKLSRLVFSGCDDETLHDALTDFRTAIAKVEGSAK